MALNVPTANKILPIKFQLSFNSFIIIAYIQHRHIPHYYKIPLKKRLRVSNERKRKINSTINQIIRHRESENQRELRLHNVSTATTAARTDEQTTP